MVLTEHFAVEIFGYGAGAPPQTSQENPIVFYALRLAATDPVLLAVAAIAFPGRSYPRCGNGRRGRC